MAKIIEQSVARLVNQLVRTQFPEGLRINIDQDQGTVTVYQGDRVLSELSFAQAQTAVNRLFSVNPDSAADQDNIASPGAS